jgi:hypothetical protein
MHSLELAAISAPFNIPLKKPLARSIPDYMAPKFAHT